MIRFVIISSALILLSTLILFLTKGKSKYVLWLNYGIICLPVILAMIVSSIGTPASEAISGDFWAFTIYGFFGTAFSYLLIALSILFIPLVISGIAIGIYRSVTLPKDNY